MHTLKCYDDGCGRLKTLLSVLTACDFSDQCKLEIIIIKHTCRWNV